MREEPAQNLKEKRDEWLSWFEGDDPHAIKNQIAWMIWQSAAYRVVNEARKDAPKDAEGRVKLNGMVHELINDTFFQSQALSIRRLADRQTSAGQRSVYSRWRLVDDIERSAGLLTRENILVAEGLEYHYERVRESWPRIRQEHIDKLAGISAESRKRGDRVRAEVFARLKRMLESCDQVVTYVHKFIAHAATLQSRAAAYGGDDPTMTLGHLYRAHETICKVANFVSVYLLGGAEWGFLDNPLFDQFAYIDRPLVASGNVAKLAEAWDAYIAEVHGWRECDDIFQR